MANLNDIQTPKRPTFRSTILISPTIWYTWYTYCRLGITALSYVYFLLQCFVEFAKTARPSQKNGQSDVDSGDSEVYKGQFQVSGL